MNISLWAVIVAAVAQFVVGAIWYMPLFGNLWGKIHGFERHSKADQAQMQRDMMPMLVVQFLMAGVTAYVLAWLIAALPNENAYVIAAWVWAGFAVPTQVSAVIFGGTAPKWVVSKIAVMAGGALVCYMVAAFVINVIK